MNAETIPGGSAGLLRPVTRPVTLGQSVYEALVELVVAGGSGQGSTWWRRSWPASLG